MEPIKAVLCGAGNRGTIYTSYALAHPDALRVVAVVEPDERRRNAFAATHRLPPERCYPRLDDCLAAGRLADCMIIATGDSEHYVPAMAALKAGYHLLLEKPIACSARECCAIRDLAKRVGRSVSICHVLRYTGFYRKIRQIIQSGVLGDVTNIVMHENVGYYHYAHSYCRGLWRKEEDGNPMLLAKCCHDLDLMNWFAPGRCRKISSFGSLRHFTKANCPADAPARCTDGCPHRNDCAFYAPAIYRPGTWVADVLVRGGSSIGGCEVTEEAVLEALKTSPYGRCVYQCDNNVVDRQVVNMEFEGGCTGTLLMTAFTPDITRDITIMGTKARLTGCFNDEQVILVKDFLTQTETLYKLPPFEGVHGGGDNGLMSAFVNHIRHPEEPSSTDIGESIVSHLMGYAAEEARHTDTVVDFDAFCRNLANE